jgi:hypothetical protein
MLAQSEDAKTVGYRLLSSTDSCVRGAAAALLALGCDGLEYFNFFCTDARGTHRSAAFGAARYEAIRDSTDRAALQGQPKQYSLQTTYGYWFNRFFERADQLPAWLEPAGWCTFRLGMAAEAEAHGRALVCQVVFERETLADGLSPMLSMNGGWPRRPSERTDRLIEPTGVYTRHIPRHVALLYRLDPAAIRNGLNEFTVFHPSDDTYPTVDGHATASRIVSVDLLFA